MNSTSSTSASARFSYSQTPGCVHSAGKRRQGQRADHYHTSASLPSGEVQPHQPSEPPIKKRRRGRSPKKPLVGYSIQALKDKKIGYSEVSSIEVLPNHQSLSETLKKCKTYFASSLDATTFLTGEGPLYNRLVLGLIETEHHLKTLELSNSQKEQIKAFLDSSLERCPIPWTKLPLVLNPNNNDWNYGQCDRQCLGYAKKNLKNQNEKHGKKMFLPLWMIETSVAGLPLADIDIAYYNAKIEAYNKGQPLTAKSLFKKYSLIYDWLVTFQNKEKVFKKYGISELQYSAICRQLSVGDDELSSKEELTENQRFTWQTLPEVKGMKQRIKNRLAEADACSSTSVTAQNPQANFDSTLLQPSKIVEKHAKNTILPVKYEQLRTSDSDQDDSSVSEPPVVTKKQPTSKDRRSVWLASLGIEGQHKGKTPSTPQQLSLAQTSKNTSNPIEEMKPPQPSDGIYQYGSLSIPPSEADLVKPKDFDWVEVDSNDLKKMGYDPLNSGITYNIQVTELAEKVKTSLNRVANSDNKGLNDEAIADHLDGADHCIDILLENTENLQKILDNIVEHSTDDEKKRVAMNETMLCQAAKGDFHRFKRIVSHLCTIKIDKKELKLDEGDDLWKELPFKKAGRASRSTISLDSTTALYDRNG